MYSIDMPLATNICFHQQAKREHQADLELHCLDLVLSKFSDSGDTYESQVYSLKEGDLVQIAITCKIIQIQGGRMMQCRAMHIRGADSFPGGHEYAR